MAVAVVLVALLAAAAPAAALEPPAPGELAGFREDGSLQRRVARAREIGDHRVVPRALEAAAERLRRSRLQLPLLQTPPPAWKGMPTRGTVNVLALPVCFSDYPSFSSRDDLHDKLFGDGDPGAFPYESVSAYYDRSSYGQLHIQGDVLPWYDTGSARSAVGTRNGAQERLIEQALDAYDATQADRGWASRYDNDGDGVIDYLIVIWTGPHNGWAGFWWGYQTYFEDSGYSVGGRRLGTYSWQWEHKYSGSPPADRSYDPLVTIHETGHALGLPDYYDYQPGYGPEGGVGGLDMMDYNWGDHNLFSKWLLDWLTPVVMSDGYGPVALAASGGSGEALVIMPGVGGGAFHEYFLVENKWRTGNNADMPAGGLAVWHVDARLDPGTGYRDYLYDNSYTTHKLLRLMEADGLEEISDFGRADAGDLYRAGDRLGPATRPSGFAYGGARSAVVVRDIAAAAATMSLFASTDWSPPASTVTGAPGTWTRRPVTLSFIASDGASGVAVTRFRVDGGPWASGSTCTLPADPATHAGDGVHTVAFRSTDNAGNVEPVRKVVVRIDTAGPTCRAPLAAGARRGAPARLAFSVSDRLSPRADVVIKVRRSDGRVVRTLKAAGVKTGVRHTKTFSCTLRRGTYRFEVSAVDLAGNRATRTGANRLRVR